MTDTIPTHPPNNAVTLGDKQSGQDAASKPTITATTTTTTTNDDDDETDIELSHDTTLIPYPDPDTPLSQAVLRGMCQLPALLDLHARLVVKVATSHAGTMPMERFGSETLGHHHHHHHHHHHTRGMEMMPVEEPGEACASSCATAGGRESDHELIGADGRVR
ncbi:hypothetical protein MFIFM68171_03080 [Madurella fahalii]|uniref:Uncharacterized protein n=1 Tax=Madurella fahalii TaxID=1157608 RepID=A0ABQ0G5L9_9PEZI